jgi:hypothetical protein
MFKEEHPYRTVTSWVEKIWSWCPCACIPFELRATPLGLLGLGRGVLKAIWDEKSTSFGALLSFKEEHPYPTVTSQVLRNMVKSMPNRLQEVIQRGGNTTKY